MLYEKTGSGYPVIFLPGLFAGGWIWDSVIKSVVERGYSAIVFKDAIPMAFGSGYKKAKDALNEVIASCDEAPYLVGNSLGALIAMHYASENMAKIKGLVMSGAPGQIEADAGVSLSELRTGDTQYARALMSNVYFDKTKVPQRGVDEISRLFSDHEIHKNIVRWLSFSRKYDVPATLNAMTVPTHFIWGKEDLITPIEPWVVLADQLDHVTMSIIANCGHSPMLEAPQKFVNDFLSLSESKLLCEG
ncbi:alpha/beta fold hydrolase [Brenneria goodwinii]|uniref:2-hydroxy-6-oxo-6-phenylhexa-2,4-dienoate hydrolase n=1 Tax=Brenneria goodwinii TaxID=1109412 RepID=A0A0G4JW38_9GAMM|nr:alpha/beta hydrolase [Brenneria goodwinii]CPR17302.1 2-hydroxy-6-oxo-6-phenylhexa-2,4-dienoate hydrolase [Brenneria goodwinii]